MFFRFGSVIVLVMLVAVTGVTLEKRTLRYRRALSHQHHRKEILLAAHTKLQVETQQMGEPVR